MKLFHKGKDGGPESTVTGYWLIEWKGGFSIALLRFDGDSREVHHTHAFNAVSWLLKGELLEHVKTTYFHGDEEKQVEYFKRYLPSFKPIITNRVPLHKVSSKGRSWALTFRGPWVNHWWEYLPDGTFKALTHGRKELSS
jgi:hypothetical protein